jgi:hypothetical protein|tara:strand:+ start:136 stop:294 length:159 start_codon:yes stop_codon:yes gene_type:complete
MSRMSDIMALIQSGETIDVIAEYITMNNTIIDKERAIALAQEFTYKYRRVTK